MGARNSNGRDALASWGSAVLLGGFVEGWLAIVGLAMMAAGAPWGGLSSARARRRIEALLAQRLPGYRWYWEQDDLLHGLPHPDRAFRAVWARPVPGGPSGSFSFVMGGAALAPPAVDSVSFRLAHPRQPSNAEGHLELLGRVAVDGRLGALEAGDRLSYADGWLLLETCRPAGAERWGAWTASVRRRLLGAKPPSPRTAVAWVRTISNPELALAGLLAHPEVHERRPDADDFVDALERVAFDRAAPRSTRLRAARLLAGRAEHELVLRALDRLVFIRGMGPTLDPNVRALRLLDATDLDAQVAAVRLLERTGHARALGALERVSAADATRASELVDAVAHAKAAIGARTHTRPAQGTLAVMPEARGQVGLTALDEGGLAVSDE